MSRLPPNELRATLEKWVHDLREKRAAIDRSIIAIRQIIVQADVIGPELADTILAAATRQQARTPSLFAGPQGDDADAIPEIDLPATKYDGTHRERVVQYLMSAGNRPATNFDIRTSVGLNRGAVAVVLYAGQGTLFEKVPPTHAALTVKMAWRLTPEQYERLRAVEGSDSAGADGEKLPEVGG